MKKKRIWELDFARGFAIIMMVFDHLMFDLLGMNSFFVNFNVVNRPGFLWLNQLARLYWNSQLRFYGHLFFVSVFLIVSGISFTFAKSNLNRAIKLMIIALSISVISYFIDVFTTLESFIVFGVIHMFAVSIFLTYILRKIWNNDLFIFGLGLIIIIIGVHIKFWELNYITSLNYKDIPGILLGVKAYGADYFGLFPYWGMIMIGTVIGNVCYKNRFTLIPNVNLSDRNIVLIAGRNSLIIFITHQFILFGLLVLIGYFLGYRI